MFGYLIDEDAKKEGPLALKYSGQSLGFRADGGLNICNAPRVVIRQTCVSTSDVHVLVVAERIYM